MHTILVIGLRYEDLLNNEMPAIKEALELADPDYIKGRNRRLKRASDLTVKAKSFLDYKPEGLKLDPFHFELTSEIEKIQKKNDEYELLDVYKK
jgi:ubiquinol-cytochrome c reductase subunit 7